MKMSRILFITFSLLLLLQLASSKSDHEHGSKLPFHSLFPFLGREEDINSNLDDGNEKQNAQFNQQLAKTNPAQQNAQFNQQLAKTNPAQLRENFYQKSCPNAEKIVNDAFTQIVKANPGAIAHFIRLQFHDCFVNGCDASVLLDYSPSGDNVEKSSMFNGLLLKGTDLVDDIKTKLEEQCPQTVSCADVMSFTTNHAMTLAGLPARKPLGGRRDALVSMASIVEANNLPLPNWSMDQMIELFNRKGFNTEEMVILLGAHSVGIAHCDMFNERLFNFQKTGKPDPTLTVEVLEELRKSCPDQGTPLYRNPPVNFDPTPNVLDNLFFKEMVDRKKTLLITDSHLLEDPRTAPIVQKLAADPTLFPKRFPEVMLKLSSVDVLTGNDGEIRKICRSTN